MPTQASKELADNFRPELSTHVGDMNKYGVVFVGFPIWHGNTPMVIRSFLEEYDLSGKTVIPFCTSGSSGISQSLSAIQKLCPSSDILASLCINRSNFNQAYGQIEEWLSSLDINTVKVSNKNAMRNVRIAVGDSVFFAKFYNNAAANALLEQFPVTFNMSELNGNEKYYYLAGNLPSESAEKPATINAGDIMSWSGNCIVMFYKTFSNSYGGYVRLGYIEDVSGLASALGSGSVQVTFTVSD